MRTASCLFYFHVVPLRHKIILVTNKQEEEEEEEEEKEEEEELGCRGTVA